jgi:hypothetical protein
MTGPVMAPRHLPLFYVRQKVTLMVNRYEIVGANPDGTEGPLLAFAQQKRMQFKEEVIFYADETKTRIEFSFKARQRLDVRAQNDVFDATGQPLGSFKKDFGTSLVRSTWHLDAPGLQALGQERRMGIAILRRVWDFTPYLGEVWVPFIFHFDFLDKATNEVVMTSERQKAIRDRYTVTVPDRRLDFRVAAALAVALDALQSR